MTLYLHTPDPPSSFVRGLIFLWQESPSFYGYMLGFLMLSLLVYSIKLKITSRTIYYTLAGYQISLCLYRETVHYSFINPQYDSIKARTKRWLTRLPLIKLISEMARSILFFVSPVGATGSV